MTRNTVNKPCPHTLEDLLVAVILEFPEPRKYFLRRLTTHDFKNRFNRIIFGTMQGMNQPINPATVFEAIIDDKMAVTGIATHLGTLSELGWLMDREGDQS
nr:hypothetical protein 9 [Desulfobulbaceae bacterium]